MRYRYPRHTFSKQDVRQLDITLHGESILDSFNKHAELIRPLISFYHHEFLTMTMTPAREGQAVPDELKEIACLRYEAFESKKMGRRFSVRVGSSSSLASASLLNARSVEYEFGYQQNSLENQKAIRLLKDLEAHSSMNADV